MPSNTAGDMELWKCSPDPAEYDRWIGSPELPNPSDCMLRFRDMDEENHGRASGVGQHRLR